MTRWLRPILAVLGLLVLICPAVIAQEVTEGIPWLNLKVGEVSGLPADEIASRDSIVIQAQVLLEGSAALQSDPILEISLRRQDKPDACITELAVIPSDELEEARSAVAILGIDTSGLSGGRYEVSVIIEYSGAETDAVDNLRSVGFLRIADPRPELHPVALRVEPAVPLKWGETATLRTVVANTGRLAAPAFRVVFEVCRHVILSDPDEADALAAQVACQDNGWIEVASRLMPGLARNAEVSVAAPADAADIAGIEAGTHRVRVRVEYPIGTGSAESTPVPEIDPSNNEMWTTIRVEASGLGRPDLTPLSITFNEDLPLGWRDVMDATVIVANIGGQDAQGLRVQFQFRALGQTAWRDLAPPQDFGELPVESGANLRAVEVRIRPQDEDLNLIPGSYEIKAHVELLGEGEEINTTNNTLIVGFSVRGTELQVEGLEVPSASIHRGDSVVVTSWIVNTGDRPATEFAVGFYLNDERFDSFLYQDTDGLEENQRTQVQGVLATRDLPPSLYDLRVVVDPDDWIPEYDEGNNTASTHVQIEASRERLAELHITDLRLDPASPVPQDAVVICTLAARNSGEIDTGYVEARLEYSRCGGDCFGVEPSWIPLPDLSGGEASKLLAGFERGEMREIRIPFSTAGLAQGAYTLKAHVDSGDNVAEMDELNNSVTVAFSVGEPEAGLVPGMNLLCRDITVEHQGDSAMVAGLIVNSGTQDVESFQVSYSVVGSAGAEYERRTVSLPGLAPGESVPYNYSVARSSLPWGSHTASVTIDPQNLIAETDEADNTCQASLFVSVDPPSGLPDLVPVAVRFDSPGFAIGSENTVERNQPLYAYVTVRNDGVIPTGSFTIAFATSHGVDIVTWNGIGPLDQAEVSHRLPTGTPGAFELSITVDPDALIWEGSESNNSIPNDFVAARPQYSVAATESARPERIDDASSTSGPVRWIGADPVTLTVYAVSVNGLIRSIDADDQVENIASVTGSVVDVDWVFGGTPYALVGTTTGTSGDLFRVDLRTGDISGRASFGSPVVAVAPAGSQKVYVAVQGGFHELVLSGSEYSVSRLVEVPGNVKEILYDADRTTTYVLSTSGVHAYGPDLASWCVLDAVELAGAPSVLTLAGTGIYVGVDAAGRGTLHAASHCTVTAQADGYILPGWRFPRSVGDPPIDAITSIVIDPRDVDPLYVSTATGSLYSLGFDGSPQWSYDAGAAIRSTPWADQRTGRIFFGDDAGIPHVLTLTATKAFDIDLSGYSPAPIRSTLVMIETRARTEFGTRLVRNYYYGTEDGAVYRIASLQ